MTKKSLLGYTHNRKDNMNKESLGFRHSEVSRVDLHMDGGIIRVLTYDPPLSYDHLEGAMAGNFFVSRLHYPSYGTLRMFPMSKIEFIDIHFAEEEGPQGKKLS